MKQIVKIIETNISKFGILILLVSFGLVTSCEENLPDTGDLADLTPPSADFSYVSSTKNFRTILFTNLSGSSSDFLWDFGNGNTSTDAEPVYTFANGEGTYPVKLTSTDGNGVSGVTTKDVVVENKLIPVFECKSFECSDRSVWGGGNASSPYSGSGSPTPPDGSGGAKLSANSTSKFLDQTIDVKGGTNYQVSFWYVCKQSGTSSGHLLIEDATSNTAFINESIPLSANASTYEIITYSFTTDASTDRLRFYIKAGDVESRYDLVEIKAL